MANGTSADECSYRDLPKYPLRVVVTNPQWYESADVMERLMNSPGFQKEFDARVARALLKCQKP